jgi:hypothetical protein
VPDPPALTVQVVLYRTEVVRVRTQLQGIVAAAARAVAGGALSGVHLAYGDSSERPVLDDGAAADVLGAAREGGLVTASYDYFGANLGSAGGSNRLAAAGGTELFLVLNPDTYPDPRLLDELTAALTAPDVGAADARQLPCEHPKGFEPGTGDTSWVSGAAMAVRRSAFDEVGGFSADVFPLYCDDVDLSWKLRLAGWRTVHVPSALVFHDKEPGPAGAMPTPTERYWAALARLLLCRRWGRRDLEAETLSWLAGHELAGAADAGADPEGEPYRRALAAYRQREAEGRLPEPVPGAERVAQFVGGNYATHRF